MVEGLEEAGAIQLLKLCVSGPGLLCGSISSLQSEEIRTRGEGRGWEFSNGLGRMDDGNSIMVGSVTSECDFFPRLRCGSYVWTL
jgi:phage protein U